MNTHIQPLTEGQTKTSPTAALAYCSMVAGFGASLGLVLGGIFADQLSWRVGFFMNIPIGIALIIAAIRMLKESERLQGAFDIWGAFSSTLGMGPWSTVLSVLPKPGGMTGLPLVLRASAWFC